MTVDELETIAQTENESCRKCPNCLHVCVAAGCLSSQSDQVKSALEAQIKAKGLDGACRVKGVGCMGLCAAGPLVSHPSKNVMYQGVTPQDAGDIVSAVEADKPVERLRCPTNVPFFTRQKKIVLENSGVIDPERIEEYIAAGGYVALHKALTTMSRAEVTEQVSRSGLRGRGGAGYPTGLKWSMVGKSNAPTKYVICNADEGDPGAFMDRSVLESDPHRVLEGMAIAAYAVGAGHGYIYVRSEYPLAVQRLKIAIRQAGRQGLLGNSIFGTPFNFEIEIRLGAGAFVCGEETALIASIGGQRGQPGQDRPSPPNQVCGARLLSLTTSKRSPTSHPLSAMGAIGTQRSEPKRAREPKLSPWRAR